MSFWKLRFSIFGTLTIIIAVSTIFFAFILTYLGILNIFSLGIMVALFNVIQWLIAPHLIKTLYRVREMNEEDSPKLYRTIQELAIKSGIKRPKLGIANISIPNAFAYRSLIEGNHVVLTQGLLEALDDEEIEAVLGHEFGHIKHRDVQIMMLVSFLPSIFYLMGRWALFASYYGGYDERRRSGGTYFIGVISMLIYFVLMLFTLSLSRLREFYADTHSTSIVKDGARKLSEGLAKIALKTRSMRMNYHREAFMLNGFKSLFISDPDMAEVDSAQITYPPDKTLVEHLMRRRTTFADTILELFSTHPHISKRLKALQELI